MIEREAQNQSQLNPGQNIGDRAFEFACDVVEFGKVLYREGGIGRVMTPQLLRCATSVSAMLEEAKSAESRRDFISKCSVGLKEAREAHVRLRVHERCKVGPADKATGLRKEADEIVSILVAIVHKTRRGRGE